MQQCWDSQSKNRPTFSDIVGSLSQSLEAMAGYIDIVAFGEISKQPKELDLPKNQGESQCEDDKPQAFEVVVETSLEETPV